MIMMMMIMIIKGRLHKPYLSLEITVLAIRVDLYVELSAVGANGPLYCLLPARLTVCLVQGYHDLCPVYRTFFLPNGTEICQKIPEGKLSENPQSLRVMAHVVSGLASSLTF